MDHVNEMRQLRCQQGLCANKTDELLSTSYHQTVEHIPNLYYIPREQSRGANNRTHSARLRLYPTHRVWCVPTLDKKKSKKVGHLPGLGVCQTLTSFFFLLQLTWETCRTLLTIDVRKTFSIAHLVML